MTLKSLAAAACISLASATTALAATVNVNFTAGEAFGTFYGLDDSDGISSATSYDLTIGTSVWTAVSPSKSYVNSFTFSSGELTNLSFIDESARPADGGSGPLLYNTTFDLNSFFIAYARTSLVGEPRYTLDPVSAVPLPAGGLLLLTGFGAVAALKRRKKRAA